MHSPESDQQDKPGADQQNKAASQPEGITIRKAVRDDCPRLMELIQELADFENASKEVTVSLDHFIESGFGAHPVWKAFVAVANGKVEGLALYYIRYSTWKGQRIYLEDLIVAKEMRGRGLGKLLFDSLLEEAKTEKYNGMVWQVLDWNEPAIEFYRKYNTKFDSEWLNCAIDF